MRISDWSSDVCSSDLGVVDGDGFVAKIIGRADGRIHAHMAHCANDHDLFDPLFLEQIVQSGFSKGVGEILGNDRFITVRLHSFVDPGTIAAGHEKRSVGHRSEEHTSELQSLMRISYAVFCLKKKNNRYKTQHE